MCSMRLWFVNSASLAQLSSPCCFEIINAGTRSCLNLLGTIVICRQVDQEFSRINKWRDAMAVFFDVR